MLRRRPGGLPYPRATLGSQTPQDTGSQPYEPRAPLVMQTPRASQIGSVDVIPNLLMTTLAVVAAVTLPPGKQLSDSAPQAKYQVQADVYSNRLVLGYNPQPQIQRWDWSAPPPKAPVYVDQPLFHPLTLGMNPQPQIKGVTDSAPQIKGAVGVDQYPNLSGTTLAPAVPFVLPVSAGRLDASAPPSKWPPGVEQQPNTLVLGYLPTTYFQTPVFSRTPSIGPQVEVDSYPNLQSTTLKPVATGTPFLPFDTSEVQPKLQQPQVDIQQNVLILGYPILYPSFAYFESAPSVPWQASADEYPGLLQTTLGVVPAAPFKTVDTSQLQAKYQVQADVFSRPLTLGVNPQPVIQRLDQSAPPPKYQTQIEVYPNLSTTTLAPPPQPIPLPLGLPVDVSQWQGKFQIQVDAYPNVLVLGYPPIIVPPVPPVGGLLPGVPPPLAGELGKGLGPYKRPDQVFGEPDPISPRITAREEIELVGRTIELPLVHVEGLTQEELAIVLLLALNETLRR